MNEILTRYLPHEKIPRVQRRLTIVLGSLLLLTVTEWVNRGSFVDAADVLAPLRWDPIQTETTRRPFSFDYAGEIYNVEPVANYELWGLVVSHNNPDGFGDIYHDDKSVDTRDLCVIWGWNLQNDDFHRVEFDSGSWTCYFRNPGGVEFDPSSLSNNHLITNSQSIRDQIDDVRIGDQIHVVGSLVNYQAASYPQFWRRSSTTRSDEGNGACEVVFVDQIEVLASGTPFWYAGFTFGSWMLLVLVLAKFALFGWEQVASRYVRREPSPPQHDDMTYDFPGRLAPQRHGLKRFDR